MKDGHWQSRSAQRRFRLTRKRRSDRSRDYRLGLEPLEDRVVLTTPLVLNVSPTENSHSFPASAAVTVSMDQAINPSTVTDQTLVVNGMQSGKALNPPNFFLTSGSSLEMSPGFGVKFDPGEVVNVTLTSGVRNTAGESAAPYVWQYSAATTKGSGFYVDSGQTLGLLDTRGVALGDVNGDGDLDAFLGNNGAGNRVWFNNGSGTMLDSGQSLGTAGTQAVALGDLDGDGDLDAFAANSDGSRIWINNGVRSGIFSAGQTLGSGSSVSLGDVDGDGDLDALAGNIWFNNGSGTFTSGQSLSGRGALGDVDNDGDLDAFIVTAGANRVWLNNGGGTFTLTTQTLGNSASQSVALGDVDNDNDLDAFVANGSNQPDKVWLNNGAGTFTDSGQNLGSTGTRQVRLGDLDGDGDLDAITTQVNSRVYLNDGAGGFTDTQQSLNNSNAHSVALGDTNGDGTLDVLVGGESGSVNKLWINQATAPAAADIFEPNNSFGAAADLDVSPFHLANQLFQTHKGLSIHAKDNDDWYKWKAAETGELNVSILFNHAFGDLDLKLYDSGQNLIGSSTSVDDNETIKWNVTKDQILYFQVTGFSGATNPSYDLVVQGGAHPPDVFVGATGNQSRSNAANLGTGSQVHSNLTIHNGGRNDWFRIVAPETDVIDVSILFSDAQGDLDLRLTDAGGVPLPGASSETPTDNEHVSYSATIGQTILVNVFGFEDATNGNYTLSIDTGNDPPTISNIADQTTNEDTPTGAIAFTIGDTETATGALALRATSSNTALVTNSNIFFGGSGSNRNVVVTPVPNQSGTTTITVTVDDGTGGQASDPFVLTVNAIADTPALSVSNARGDEDSPIPLTISASPTDLDGSETVSVLIAGVPTGFGARLSAGTNNGGGLWTLTTAQLPGLTVTPPNDDDSDFTLTVTARATESVSGSTADAVATINVTVDETNDVPTISNIPNQNAQEDTVLGPIAFTVNDTETPANLLNVSAASSDQQRIPNGNIALGGSGTNRSITITPGLNQTGGPVAITISAFDGVNTSTRSFNVTIFEGNDVPTISSIASPQDILEDTSAGPLSFTIADEETPAGSLTLSGSSSNPTLIPVGNITFGGSGANRTVTVTPAKDQFGTATITVNVSDGGPIPGSTSFVVNVQNTADAPTVSPIFDQTTDEDTTLGPVAFSVNDTDTPVGQLTVTATSNNQALVPDANIVIGGSGANSNFRITPAANQNGGPVTITITASDGPLSGSGSFNLTINPVNDPPFVADPIEDISVGKNAGNITIDLATVFGDIDLATGGSLNYVALSNTNTALVGATVSGSILTLSFRQDRTGSATITTRAVDDASLFVNDVFVVTVSDNAAPTISDIAAQSTNEDTSTGAIAFTVGDAETPVGSLVVSATSDNQALIPDGNIQLGGSGANRTVTLTPVANQNGGPANITVTVNDGTQTTSESFGVTVQSVNDAPVNTVPGMAMTDQNAPLVFSTAGANRISISDVDAGGADVEVMVSVTHGTVTLATTAGLTSAAGDGTGAVTARGPVAAINAALDGVTYTPDTDYFGMDTLSINSNDLGNTGGGGAKSALDMIPLIVKPSNQPPVITSADTVQVSENTASVMTVTANDPNGDTVTFSIIGGADQASFAMNNITGALLFLAAPDFENPTDANGDNVYEVQVSANDGKGGVASQLVQVTVVNADETAPTVQIVGVTPDPRAGAVVQVTIQFSEPVTGFDVSDLTLMRSTDTAVSLLPGAATLTSADNVTWTLGNLTELTKNSGIYDLTVKPTGTGIQDLQGTPLAGNAAADWTNGAGDANTDNSFDQFDIIKMLQAGLYLTGLPATWSTGDFNRDGLFNQFDIIVAQQTQPSHYLQGPFAARAAMADQVFQSVGGGESPGGDGGQAGTAAQQADASVVDAAMADDVLNSD